LPKYINAREVLPAYLLRELQKYAEGKQLYVPKREENHLGWGERSGYREEIRERNRQLRGRYAQGHSVEELARDFCLSEATIRKLVYGQSPDHFREAAAYGDGED